MSSSIISKKEVGKYRIEKINFENFESDKDLIDELLNRAEINTEEERKRIRQVLDEYFLNRNEMKEKQKKFLELFAVEFQQSKKEKPSEKFLDFLILKNISGRIRKTHKSLIPSQMKIETQEVFTSFPDKENPRLIRDDKGRITAIEVDCKCGETVRIDFEISE
ncbi:MAG: hypothetical protein ACUVQ1_04430 [Candidatus Kapaibacteriales bacterium]